MRIAPRCGQSKEADISHPPGGQSCLIALHGTPGISHLDFLAAALTLAPVRTLPQPEYDEGGARFQVARRTSLPKEFALA